MKRLLTSIALACAAASSTGTPYSYYSDNSGGADSSYGSNWSMDGSYDGSNYNDYQTVTVYGSYTYSGGIGFSNGASYIPVTAPIDPEPATPVDPVVALNAPNLSTDVRCNPLAQANETVRTTTHATNAVDKWVAANTLFRIIQAQMGLNFRTALAVLPTATGIILSNGKSPVLWKTTWSDGSTTTFLVEPFLPPNFTDQQPPDSETPPTGDTACPTKAVGISSVADPVTPAPITPAPVTPAPTTSSYNRSPYSRMAQ
jgi:hypothetical protein